MNHDMQYLGIDSAMIGGDRKECNLNVYLAPFSYSGEIHPTSINNTVHWGIFLGYFALDRSEINCMHHACECQAKFISTLTLPQYCQLPSVDS